MSKFTDFLNLFKWDSIADAEEEFNIDKALNENWDKIDTKLKTYITNLQANKVDKEDGKNLSTNDYTNKEKEKLNNIESNAQVNLIEKIQKNGIDIDIINKMVNLILTKNDVGLDNVDNTSDIDKPLSNAVITELAKKLDKTSKATSTEAIAGTNNTKYTTPCSVKSAIDKALEGYTPSGGGSGGDTLPIGAILPFSSDTIPNGWLLCDGSVIEQEDYPELFEVLAGNYGIISREEIRLPDLRGKVTVGKDSTDTDFNTLGKTGGEKTHTLTVSEMPKHSHNFQFDQTEGSNVTAVKTGVNNAYAKATSETGGNQPHNNLQPYLVTNYIIKAKNTVVVKGDVIQENGTASETNVYSAKAIDNKLKTSVKVEESGDGYTKYSDGTMVCYGTASVTNPSFDDWYGFCRLANETTTNLVKTFKDNNYSLTMTSKTFGYFTAMITSKTASSFKFRAFTHNNTAYNPGNGTFDYIAIGKWK
mgnify:CR=1 FL=1|jgi:microcystin-dependent protein